MEGMKASSKVYQQECREQHRGVSEAGVAGGTPRILKGFTAIFVVSDLVQGLGYRVLLL